MIRNIIFDIGNVLTNYRWKEFLLDKGFDEQMVLRIAAASVASPAWYEVDRGVFTDEELMAAFVANDPEIEEELHTAFDEIYDLVTPRDYAIPWVMELKANGYGVYYLSNFSQKANTECAEALTFIPYMDGGILSYREKLIKPDPAIYQLLLDRYGLRAEECVFVDDTPANVDGAKAQGMQGIQFITREQVLEEMRTLGIRI